MAKLTKDQKAEMIQKRLAGEKLTNLATEYGVSAAYVSQATKKLKPLEQNS